MTTIEDELGLVKDALHRGNVKHAVHHLAGAVAMGPVDPRVASFVDELAVGGESVLDLVVIDDGVFHGMAALRALLLQRLGQPSEAADLLWRCQRASARTDYLGCIEEGLARLGPPPITAAKKLYASALQAVDGLPRSLQARAADLLARISNLLPDDDGAFFAACVAVRKSGRSREAEAMALGRVKGRPSHSAFVALGGARREFGDDEGAVEAYRNASRLKPSDPGCLLDCGDLLVDLRRPDDALQAYEQVLAIAPGHPWAQPSALFLRARAGDPAARAELMRIAGIEGASARARDLATKLAPFDFELPARHDACLALLWQTGPENRPVSIASSSLEAPSAYRVLRLLSGPDLTISAHVPTPDPRIPRAVVPFVLWRYGPTGWRRLLGGELPLEAEPAVDAPSAEAMDLIADLARRPYSRDGWWEEAVNIGRRLSGKTRPSALGAMVHWPEGPLDAGLADFAFRVQVASALLLAGSGDGAALRTILDGPADWAGTAALVGLTELAARQGDRTARERVVSTALDEDVNPIRWQCLIEPAIQLSALLTDIDAETASRLAMRRQEADDV